MSSPHTPRHSTRQAGLVLMTVLALGACKRESASPPTDAGEPQPPVTAPAGTVDAPVELKDIIETNDRYVVGISYPATINRYPGLADIWPLSPLQFGLLFHAQYDTDTADAYTVTEADARSGAVRRASAIVASAAASAFSASAMAAESCGDGHSSTGGVCGLPPLPSTGVWLSNAIVRA